MHKTKRARHETAIQERPVAQQSDLLSAVEGAGIVVYGMIVLPLMVVDTVAAAISGYFKNARPVDFEAFFRSGLYFEEILAKNLTARYLACADAFGFAPGLGATKGGLSATLASIGTLESELKKLGVGKFAGSGNAAKLELKLSEFLNQQKSPLAAKSALTPAKRDALAAEARKLLSVSAEAFKPYYKSRFTAIGVRG